MQCPKCYGKIDPNTKRCRSCGFNINSLDGATNKAAKKAKKTIYKDDILYTTKIPPDVSKKKLLLFSIFLGIFGVHDFYVGKFWQGLYLALSTGIATVLALVLIITNTIAQNLLQNIYAFVSVFEGLAVIITIWDIFKIAFERFKIPVYKDEFSR